MEAEPHKQEKAVLDAQGQHWQTTFIHKPEMFGGDPSEPAAWRPRHEPPPSRLGRPPCLRAASRGPGEGCALHDRRNHRVGGTGRQVEARAAPRRARPCTRGGGRMGAGAQAQDRKGGDVRSIPERLADEVRDGGQAQTEEGAAAAQTGPTGRIRTTGLRNFEYPCSPSAGYPCPFAANSFRIRIAMPISPLIHLRPNTS